MDKVSTEISTPKELFSFKLFLIIFSIHILAIPAIFYFSISNLIIWAAAHLFFGTIGASIGLHRYCSHRSFEYKSNCFKTFVTAVSTLCFQGGPVLWAAAHREHHRYSEKFGDPHDARRGFFWSHMGWLFFTNPNGFTYIKSLRVTSDLKKDKIINFFEVHSVKINLIFLSSLFILSYAINDLGLFFWLGPLRIVTVWHSTWLINSYAHNAHKPLKNRSIQNSIVMSLLIGGDGDHLYHHEYPSKIKHSQRKFHFDYGYGLIYIFKRLGLIDFGTKRNIQSHSTIKKAASP